MADRVGNGVLCRECDPGLAKNNQQPETDPRIYIAASGIAGIVSIANLVGAAYTGFVLKDSVTAGTCLAVSAGSGAASYAAGSDAVKAMRVRQ